MNPTSGSDSLATAPIDDSAQLQFFIRGKLVRAIAKRELRAAAPVETIAIADGEYDGKRKTWRALPLGAVLAKGFAGAGLDLAAQAFVLRCLDGYAVPIAGSVLTEDGGYLAIADADVLGWQSVGPRQLNPGPYFLVWKKPEQQDEIAYPRPYQLAAIEVARFEDSFPHVVPAGEKDGSPALRGLALFREQCIRCHAINQEGGRVGPDLNVPKSIVEYRPEEQIKAYIRDPRSFRYGTMPAHPNLSDADLDALVAYFRAMSARKHDPNARK